MRLSVFSVLDAFPPSSGPERDRYGELLALARVADTSGLSAVWVAEHHFHDGGLDPAPAVLLAAVAAQTQRVRLGSMVSVLPFHDPVEVAEQYALLDRVSGGRLNLGVGSGYIPTELEGFAVDPTTKRERFDRSLETLLAAFRGEAVRPADGRGRPSVLNVRPRQRPHPPIWIAAQRREALVPIARRGFSVALIPYATVSGPEELAEEIREFRTALPDGSTAEVAAAVHLYAGDSAEPARAALQRYLDARLATGSRSYEEKVRHDPTARSAAAIESAGLAVLGSPSVVRAGLERFRAAGVDELLGIFDFGGLPLAEVLGSVRHVAANLSARQSGAGPIRT